MIEARNLECRGLSEWENGLVTVYQGGTCGSIAKSDPFDVSSPEEHTLYLIHHCLSRCIKNFTTIVHPTKDDRRVFIG
jgi:hypothetical protein